LVKKSSKQTSFLLENDLLTLDYTLAELPSSQHRSGLAGLVLMVRWLHRFDAWKQDGSAICEIENLSNRSVTLRINQLGLQALFNEVYQAYFEERNYDQPKTKGKGEKKTIVPWKGHPAPGSIKDEKTGKSKKVYPYDDVIPKGAFLADIDPDGDRGRWIKLWRDLLWSILRGVPATRSPYESRANGNYTDDADKAWEELLQPAEFTVDLPSTYYIGAQASNPENVPFKDRARYQFLLHFWVFAASVYVPAIINNEGKRDFVGYAIAIPDIAQLELFCDEFLGLLRERGNEVTGYRPRDAVVDLAVEGALDLMARLRDRVSRLETSIGDLVMGVDVIHTEKQGNNVRILGTTRLDPPEREWIDKYREIREHLWHSTFRRQRLLNLVSKKAWYMGFDSLLCTIAYEQTMENEYFCHDVRESFKYEVENMADETEQNSDIEVSEYSCEKLVLRLVKSYVLSKLDGKYQLKWKEVQGSPKEKEYREKKAKIAKSAFLDVRSRTEKSDFINYFASTICSVSQRMNEDSFEKLTRDLYEDTDKVRTLTMLALSANS
jgi:CRISPR-associated protein Cmx8